MKRSPSQLWNLRSRPSLSSSPSPPLAASSLNGRPLYPTNILLSLVLTSPFPSRSIQDIVLSLPLPKKFFHSQQKGPQ
ncbi:hypothetical protein ACLOJK_000063 [Asimina triloba]